MRIEACEKYQKQTWRNRCRFLAGDGPQDLRVPVVHENGSFALPIKQIKVDYSTPWVVRTERAIASAYHSSAFFDYYQDELFAILDSHPETLWELNTRITDFFVRKIGLKVEFQETDTFQRPCGEAGDYREVIHPKRPNRIMDELGIVEPYYQVFSDRFGFVPGLSIMDLLFNEGPESICHLLP